MERSITHRVKTYYDLALPKDKEKGLPLLIATHGYSGTKESMLRLAKRVDGHRFAIASLQGIHQHFKKLGDPRTHKQEIGFGWLSPWKPEESQTIHHDSIETIISDLSTDGTIDPERVFLLGFSQSVALNLRFALTFPGRIKGVVGICGGVPFDLKTNPIYHTNCTDVLAIHMNKDEFYPPERVETNVKSLNAFARELTVKTLEGGHTIAPGMFPIIETWLKSHLDDS